MSENATYSVFVYVTIWEKNGIGVCKTSIDGFENLCSDITMAVSVMCVFACVVVMDQCHRNLSFVKAEDSSDHVEAEFMLRL